MRDEIENVVTGEDGTAVHVNLKADKAKIVITKQIETQLFQKEDHRSIAQGPASGQSSGSIQN